MNNLDDREFACVLAALRCFQQHMEMNGGIPGPDFIGHFDDVLTPLTTDEIDDLCESINTE